MNEKTPVVFLGGGGVTQGVRDYKGKFNPVEKRGKGKTEDPSKTSVALDTRRVCHERRAAAEDRKGLRGRKYETGFLKKKDASKIYNTIGWLRGKTLHPE